MTDPRRDLSNTCPICKHSGATERFVKNYTYEVWVCKLCARANRSGWSLDAERQLIPHMLALGKQLPKRNENGWLPYEVYEVVQVIDR
ncbi:MAG: hypothetical protein ABJG14_11095 [Sulfitobacter sp.]|uniref:hypothetical protein n=1 Tax=Alphaproteobacteria TaxID=28211 RepID=UPI0032668CFA